MGAKKIFGDIGHELGEGAFVVHGRGDAAVVHTGLAAMAAAQGMHRVFDPSRQPIVHLEIQASHCAQQSHVVGDHIERLAPFNPTETHHHRMQGIQPAADGLLQAADHPGGDPDGVSALVGPGPMATLAEHLDLQFPSHSGEAAAAHPNRPHRQARKHMHAKQGPHPLHGACLPHPAGPLGCLLRRLKQQAHPARQPIRPAGQQPPHPKANGGVNVMAAGMHQALLAGGIGKMGALLDGQGIHVGAQGDQRSLLRAQFRDHPRAAHPFAHLPAPAAQLARHQRGRLLLMATQLGVAMDMTPQLHKVGQGRLETSFVTQGVPVGGGNLHGRRSRGGSLQSGVLDQVARERNCPKACTASGGQRRICSSHSSWR